MSGGDPASPGTGLWCRACGQPARVEGDPEYGRAVHADSGEELGDDGHLCLPVEFETGEMRAARLQLAGLRP